MTIHRLMLFAAMGCDPDRAKSGDTGTATSMADEVDDDSESVPEEDPPQTDNPNVDDQPFGTIVPTGGSVLDPKLGENPELGFSVEIKNEMGCPISVSITNGIGQERSYPDPVDRLSWNGRDDHGHPFDPGTATVALRSSCDAATEVMDVTQAHVIRIGLHEIDFVDPEAGNGIVSLAFHKSSLSEVEVYPIGERAEYTSGQGGELGSSIDHDDGSARSPVPIWANPDVPPWADDDDVEHNVPSAYITGRNMAVQARVGSVAVSQARSIAVPAWGPVPDEMPNIRLVDDEQAVLPDIRFSRDLGTAPTTMGRHTRTIEWRFESESEDGRWHPIPGEIETQHALYVLVDEPALLDGRAIGASPAIPWVGVLHDTATIMDGVPATVSDTLDALRDYLFGHDYVLYDPSSPTYTEYEGSYMYWSSITAQMSSFLDRRAGLRLYCHSMSCMLSALAGNHGVRAEQIVLGVNFTTNYARAAGTDSWDRWTFNSHSVVTPDDGETIWDSSIALDGDAEQDDDERIEEIMPRGMGGEEYIRRLTGDDIEIINQSLCYIE